MTQEEKETLENMPTLLPTTEQRQRAERSDKGKPRLFVDAPGVRFDLGMAEGRGAFKSWCATSVETNAYGIDELLNLVDRLLQKHGVQ